MALTPAKYKVLAQSLVLLGSLLLFTPNVLASIVVSPQNALVNIGQSVTFNCSSNDTSDGLVWLESGLGFVSDNPTTCSPLARRAATIRTTWSTYNCDVTFLSISTTDAGPISCQEPLEGAASDAEVIVLQSSSCGVPSNTPVVQGTTIPIPCRFDYIKQAFAQSYAPTMSTYTNWTYTSSASVLTVSPSTTLNPTDKTGSIVSNATVTVTGTVLPSFTCTGVFTFTAPAVPDSRFQYALNPVSTSCVTTPVNVQYCSTTVSITPALPANGQILAGTTFNCSSDGYPVPTYTWKITGGTISTNSGSTTTITSGGPFTLTCTATATVGGTQPCVANATITGTSIVCPSSSSSITITDINKPATSLSLLPSANVNVNDTFNCSTTFTYPAATSYQWSMDGLTTSIQTQTYVLQTPGIHNLTCTPQITGTSLCPNNVSNTVSVFAIDCPITATITKVPSPANTYSCSVQSVATASYSWIDSISAPVTSSVSGSGQNYTVPSTPGYHLLNCTAAITAPPVSCTAVSATYNVTVIGCPKTVQIAYQPNGQWISGQTIFNCTSTNGFPAVSYKWYNDTTFLQNGFTFSLLNPGYYILTCVATASDGFNSCSTNNSVTGSAVACPQNVTIASISSGIYTVGDSVTCSSTGGFPSPTYLWNPGSVSGSTYLVNTPGQLTLTCTANVSGCQSSASVNITVQATTTTVRPTTTTTTLRSTAAQQPSTVAATTTTRQPTTASVTTAKVTAVQPTGVAEQATTQAVVGLTTAVIQNAPTSAVPTTQTTKNSGATTAAAAIVQSTNSGGDGTTSVFMSSAGMTTGTRNETTTSATSNSMNLGALIAAIVVPSSLGLLALSLIACYCCFAAASLPERVDDKEREQTESPQIDDNRLQLPVNEESSFYAPGYAFNGASYAAGYGRF